MEKIRQKGAVTDDIAADLKTAVTEFKQGYRA
jgi:hypothetical protein